MRAYDIIKKKRDGGTLTKEEIDFFIASFVKGEIPDYQASAFLMAVYFRSMNKEETTALTLAIRDSGRTLECFGEKGKRVDKHSTGGVGDKTSLVVAPIVSACGVTVAKMSGRGLGHTGGTIDKLESIEGFKVDMSTEEFENAVKKSGIAIVGQSSELAPADKLLYALRDVTATVDSIPLIASSIMGKKLAANDDCIVLDVKTGSGSFMKEKEEAKKLARAMVDIGTTAGKKTVALVTDMDAPLGRAIGNSLEVIEAIETLNGKGEGDFVELCIALASYMLFLVGKGKVPDCEKMAREVLANGKAKKKFADMINAQGGNGAIADDPSLMKKAKYTDYIVANESGFISEMNAEKWGVSAQLLGAGRSKKEDEIDYLAGIYLNKKRGERVEKGEIIATLYASNERLFLRAKEVLDGAYRISENEVILPNIVYEVIE